MIKEEQKKKVRQKKKEEEHAKTMREYRKKEIDEEREKQLRRKNHETCMQTSEEKEADRQAESAVIQFLWKISGQNGNNNNDSEIHFIDSKEILQKRMATLQEVEERKKENTQQVSIFYMGKRVFICFVERKILKSIVRV